MIYPFNAYEVFKMAIQIEENGYKFYQEASKKDFPDEIKSLFNTLAQEELKHLDKFKIIQEKLPEPTKTETVWDPDNEIDKYLKMMADSHVFITNNVSNSLKNISSFKEAIMLAQTFEKDTIIFFLEMEHTADKHESQKEIKKLVEEEQKHLRLLSSILQKYKNN